jgi:ubiquinone/menaquinone biosynthesis C-methylase UbiE
LDIPFKDKTFDLVFTSGLLIHIAPRDIKKVMSEIYRCTKKYIWGLEYYSAKYVEINYREHNNLLWKADFSKLYRDTFTDLEMVREERLRYTYDSNVDSMFLLKKTMVR